MFVLFALCDISPCLRVHKYASCSNECFILALIYIDRLIQRSNFLLTELNVHRVVITSVLLAAKFFDDAYYNNAYYAKVGGVLVSEMNGLEVDFLFRINFSLHVTPDVFEKYRAELMMHSTTVQTPLTPVMESMHNEVPIVVPPSHHIDPALMVTHNFMTTFPMTDEVRVSSPITPSPPVDAAVMSDAMDSASFGLFNSEHARLFDAFFPMQRANTLPAAITPASAAPYYIHVPQVMPPAPSICLAPKIAFTEGTFAMMENRIFPIHASLVHHHHGGMQRATSDGAVYNAYGRVLTGVSGP